MKILQCAKNIPEESIQTENCFVYGLDSRKGTFLRVAGLFAASVFSLTNAALYSILPPVKHIPSCIVTLLANFMVLQNKELPVTIVYLMIISHLYSNVTENYQKIKQSIVFTKILVDPAIIFDFDRPCSISKTIQIALEHLQTQQTLGLARTFAGLSEDQACNLARTFLSLSRKQALILATTFGSLSEKQALTLAIAFKVEPYYFLSERQVVNLAIIFGDLSEKQAIKLAIIFVSFSALQIGRLARVFATLLRPEQALHVAEVLVSFPEKQAINLATLFQNLWGSSCSFVEIFTTLPKDLSLPLITTLSNLSEKKALSLAKKINPSREDEVLRLAQILAEAEAPESYSLCLAADFAIFSS